MKILSFTAINPTRRFPFAEAQILQLENVSQFVFDASDEAALPWHVNVLRKYQAARQMTLDGNFDALFTAESDMLIPPDAVTRLSALDAPVAYGIYVLRHGVPLWNTFIALDENAGFSLSDTIAREHAPHEWNALCAGKPFPIYGAGFGCTLIQRDVLKKLEFRNWLDEDAFYTDWLFAADCNTRGILQMTDPAVTCGHIAGDSILFPDVTQHNLYRVENRPAQREGVLA